jgi:hypothetical protein
MLYMLLPPRVIRSAAVEWTDKTGPAQSQRSDGSLWLVRKVMSVLGVLGEMDQPLIR